MKTKLKNCEKCGEETIQMIKKSFGHKGRGRGHHLRRVITHCTECGRRIIKNTKKGTYTK